MKYVEWIEPYDNETDTTLICRLTVEDAIKAQRHHAFAQKGFVYETEQQALDDFVTVHWAKIVEG